MRPVDSCARLCLHAVDTYIPCLCWTSHNSLTLFIAPPHICRFYCPYRHSLSESPLYYSYDVAGAHVIMLSSYSRKLASLPHSLLLHSTLECAVHAVVRAGAHAIRLHSYSLKPCSLKPCCVVHAVVGLFGQAASSVALATAHIAPASATTDCTSIYHSRPARSLQPRQRAVRLAAAGPGRRGSGAHPLAHCVLPRALVQLELRAPGAAGALHVRCAELRCLMECCPHALPCQTNASLNGYLTFLSCSPSSCRARARRCARQYSMLSSAVSHLVSVARLPAGRGRGDAQGHGARAVRAWSGLCVLRCAPVWIKQPSAMSGCVLLAACKLHGVMHVWPAQRLPHFIKSHSTPNPHPTIHRPCARVRAAPPRV